MVGNDHLHERIEEIPQSYTQLRQTYGENVLIDINSKLLNELQQMVEVLSEGHESLQADQAPVSGEFCQYNYLIKRFSIRHGSDIVDVLNFNFFIKLSYAVFVPRIDIMVDSADIEELYSHLLWLTQTTFFRELELIDCPLLLYTNHRKYHYPIDAVHAMLIDDLFTYRPYALYDQTGFFLRLSFIPKQIAENTQDGRSSLSTGSDDFGHILNGQYGWMYNFDNLRERPIIVQPHHLEDFSLNVEDMNDLYTEYLKLRSFKIRVDSKTIRLNNDLFLLMGMDAVELTMSSIGLNSLLHSLNTRFQCSLRKRSI